MQTPVQNSTTRTPLPDSITWNQVQNYVQQQNPGFILASPLKNDSRSQFQFAGIFPETLIKVFDDRLEVSNSGNIKLISLSGKNPLEEIEKITNLTNNDQPELPLKSGGWFFTFSYEFSDLLNNPLIISPSKTLRAAGFKPGVLFRHELESGKIDLIADSNTDVDNLIKNLTTQSNLFRSEVVSKDVILTENFKTYQTNVESIRQHIKNGDTYEVNYVHQLTGRLESGTPEQVWESLVTQSASSFFTWFKLGDFTLVSSSPERFFKTSSRKIIVQPMKGTRRRDPDDLKDKNLKAELIGSEKDKAENLMIVDLMRNDLGKICETGSVSVSSLFEVESYQTVHQMISTVTGKLPENLSIFKIIEALFPPGSMTGAPKKRTMEIIRKHESGPRGFYSGISGYVDYSGNSEWSVLIRCLEFNGSEFSAKAGGAITSDSNAEQEYAETITKLKGILESLKIKPESIKNLDPGPIKKGY